MCGHNCRSCTNTRPLPVKGVRKCGCCGEVGHNKRTCPKNKEDQVEQKFQVELALLLADEVDEEPLPQDLELTPTPRAAREEVEISTEGYREICGLDHDVMLMVGEEVGKIRVKINQDWWNARTHPRFGIAGFLGRDGWLDVLHNIKDVGSELEEIGNVKGYHKVERQTTYTGVRQGVSLQKCLRGSVGTQKGVRKHTWAWKETNRMSGCPSTYWSWRHTLAERREIQQAHKDYYCRPR